MSEKRSKRDKSRGTIKGGVGGEASADAEGVKENREGIAGLYREWWVIVIEVERVIKKKKST